MIPHMGGARLGPWIEKYRTDKAIVEIGCWLGGVTQYLSGDVTAYDGFTAKKSEVEKARAFGVELIEGQDTLELVSGWFPEVRFVKGDLMRAEYRGGPIGLYIDDASKTEKLWHHSMSVFEPHFEAGTILFLMDYDYPPCEVQREYAKKWTLLERKVAGTSCAILRC